MKDHKTLIDPAALTIGVFLFYLTTLAPTVLWGDDAFFQWSATVGYLQPDGGGHWLHFFLARLFIHFPLGDAAFRVNLLSAVAAALTVLFIFASGRALQLSNSAAAAGALSLTVAHTFWTHAVRAEVYTVFTMLLALIIWLLITWRQERPFVLYAAAFLLGPTLLSHQMLLLLLPAFTLFLWLRRDWLQLKNWLLTGAAFAIGLILAIWLIQTQVGRESVPASLLTYFTQSGANFSQAIFDFSMPHLLADLGFWLAMLALQFVGPALLLALLGLRDWRKRSAVLLPLLIFYAITVLFAISYRVNDRFVFFLPGYLVIALLVSLGWQALWEKRPKLAQIALPSLALIPFITYALLPGLLTATGIPLPNIRTLPGREPVSFFLWPAKNGYTGAANYGHLVLDNLPPNSIILADHTPFETLNYFQKVEAARPDVLLVKIDSNQNLALLIEKFEKNRPIYLADNNPAYYNVSSLPNPALIPEGMIYRIDRE